jgi:hypothetical protein
VALSLENLANGELNGSHIVEVNLLENRLKLEDGRELESHIEEIWPPFSFLKGMGFKGIKLQSPSTEEVERWSERIEGYQHEVIADPDYIIFEECIWDEEAQQGKQIECLVARPRYNKIVTPTMTVPPMRGPIQIDKNSIAAFVEEIRNYKDKDTLTRMHSILIEFRHAKDDVNKESFVRLLGDLIAVALEKNELRKAIRLATEHRQDLKSLWSDETRAERILAAYEPTQQEVEQWARIFETFELDHLVGSLKRYLSTPAGPQLTKLMNYRAQNENEKLTEICIQQPPDIQKILLQWLSPFWQPKHYGPLFSALLSALQRRDDLELVNYWIQALLQSYRSQALSDLKSLFKPVSLIDSLMKKKKKIPLQQQRDVLKAISEHPSAEVIHFLKDIKPYVRGGVADEVERVIHAYHGGKKS